MHISKTHGQDFTAKFFTKGELRGKIVTSKEGVFLAFNDVKFKSPDIYVTKPPAGFRYLFKLGNTTDKLFLLSSKGISNLTIGTSNISLFGAVR